jgi:hypothetical protein
MNNDAQIHIVSLHADLTGVAVDEGVVLFYNKGSDAVIRVSTPFGSVSESSRSSFDLYVDDTSLEVVALKGRVSFFHTSDQQEYEVIAGSSSLVADRHQVTAGKGIFDRNWEAWNNRRDKVWHMRAQRTGESSDYLPPQLSDEAYVLDSSGKWARVYYDGAYWTFWRPVHVSIGWAPFTMGTWMMWHGDYCWLPGEPFDYVTHHYGNWVLVNNLWYWAPPVTGVRVRFGSPFLHIRYAKRSSAGNTTDQAIKKRTVRVKNEKRRAAKPKFFRNLNEGKRSKVAAREKCTFRHKKRNPKG